MTVSAREVAEVLRKRLPGVGTKKLHKLMYYCQGHHLAALGEPLFSDTISAWDMGPVVGALWHAEKYRTEPPDVTSPRLTEGQLNTIGYVVSRYGALTGRDLENLTHAETPWQLANAGRRPNETARIEIDWIRDYFINVATSGDEDEVTLDSAAVSEWLAGADERQRRPARPDSLEEIQARLSARG